MKIPIWSVLSATIVCAIVFPATPAALAKEQSLNAGAEQQAPAPHNAKDLFDIDIKANQTVGQLLTWLRDRYPTYNFLCSPDALDVKLDEVKLRSISLYQLFNVLPEISKGRIDPSYQGNIYAIRLNQSSLSAERRMEAFNLADYLNALDGGKAAAGVDNLRTMVMDTLAKLKGQELREAERPSFSFYPDAKLLVVTGSPEAIDATAKILRAVSGKDGPAVPAAAQSTGTNVPPAVHSDP